MRYTLAFVLVVAAALLQTAPAAAGVPQLISFQGRVTDAQGDPAPDGNYDITVTIFDAAVSGAEQWSETHVGVPVTGGIFNVVLGSSVPLTDSVFSGAERFLEISVNGEPISPRTQITSVGYAQRVATVDGATGGEILGTTAIVDTVASRASALRIELSGSGISLYDPVDSKSANAEPVKRLEFRNEGMIMYGATEAETTLFVAPNGDIVGRGQITMGENSSPGEETSVLGFQNTANGDSSAIGGGSGNVTNGTISVIGGGYGNTTEGEGSVISGGATNDAAGNYATVGGGQFNTADGDYATVPGGVSNSADAPYSYAAGRRAKALTNGSFVWADQTDEDFTSTGDDQFIVRASGGVGIGTNTPTGQLEVAGAPGDSSVTLPDDAISAREIMDEPGLAGARQAAPVILTQLSSSMQTLVAVTITIPADGWIMVQGGATFESHGTSGANYAFLQIDDAEGGPAISPFFVLAGNGDHDSPNKLHYFPMAAQRIFARPAGTYTFYLEAQADPTNGDGSVSTMMNQYVSAMFFPTAYGAIPDQVSPNTPAAN